MCVRERERGDDVIWIRNETNRRIINLSCLWFMGNGFPSANTLLLWYDRSIVLTSNQANHRVVYQSSHSDRTGAIGMRCVRIRARKLCRSVRHAWRPRFVAGCSCGRMHNSTPPFVIPRGCAGQPDQNESKISAVFNSASKEFPLVRQAAKKN